MTRDEAMKVWREAFGEWALQLDKNVADIAAATVIQQAFSERDGEIERLRQALGECEGVLSEIPAPSSSALWAEMLSAISTARQALAAKGDSRG